MSKNVSPPWMNYEDLKSWFVAHGRNKGQTQEFIEKTLEDDPRINAHHFLVFFAPVQPAYNNDEFERKREEFFEAQLLSGKTQKGNGIPAGCQRSFDSMGPKNPRSLW